MQLFKSLAFEYASLHHIECGCNMNVACSDLTKEMPFQYMQHRWYTVVCEFQLFSKVLLMVKRNFLGFFSAG